MRPHGLMADMLLLIHNGRWKRKSTMLDACPRSCSFTCYIFFYFMLDWVSFFPLNNVNSIQTASERAHLDLTEAFESKERTRERAHILIHTPNSRYMNMIPSCNSKLDPYTNLSVYLRETARQMSHKNISHPDPKQRRT